MAEFLKVSLIQTSLFWENKTRNMEYIEKKLDALAGEDLILLPEMFSTGFSMRSQELAESMEGETVRWMEKQATGRQSVIAGSFICQENGKYYNRMVWMQPDGTCEWYDKRHLFRMGMEHDHYSAGNARKFIEYKGWKISLLVCYDLRFPVWCRQPHGEKPFDLQLFVANWPEKRSFAWKSLLTARAIENQCYVAGVNRVGKDGNGVDHSGDSILQNFRGEPMSSIPPSKECIETVTLSLKELESFRSQFPAGLDADKYHLG